MTNPLLDLSDAGQAVWLDFIERKILKDGAFKRLIDDDGIGVVVASWKEHDKEIEGLIEDVRFRPSRATYRRLNPFQVNLHRYELAKVSAMVAEEAPGLFVWRGGYDPDLGLTADNVDVLLIV